jgi:hypothetical protein
MPRDDPDHGGYQERDASSSDDRPPPAAHPRSTQQSTTPGVVESPSGLTLYVFGTEDLDAILEKAPALFRTTSAQQSRGARQRGVRDEFEVTAEPDGGFDAIIRPPNGNCASCPTNVIC